MIYQKALDSVRNGAKFNIDINRRNFSIGKKRIIFNGEYKEELGVDVVSTEEALCEIERLYGIYRTSLPSERSDNRKKTYFKALDVDELTDEQMCNGELREVAHLQLELYVLCSILNGSLKWNNETMGNWFWKSSKHNDLIILKSSVTNN